MELKTPLGIVPHRNNSVHLLRKPRVHSGKMKKKSLMLDLCEAAPLFEILWIYTFYILPGNISVSDCGSMLHLRK